MISYQVFDAFYLGPLSINFYGIFFALGIIVAIILAKREAKKRNISFDIIEELSIYLIFGIIIGARSFYLLFFWPENVQISFLDIFAVWNGGMAFFGGFIGAVFTGYIFCKKHNLDYFKFLDLFTIPIIVGHIFGRIGGYLIGNHPGKIVSSDYIFAIFLEGAYRHPVELYDLIGLIIILGIILLIKNKYKLKKGILFAIYVLLYGFQRLFVIDNFRTITTDPRYFGFTASQYIIIILIIFSFMYIYKNYKLKK